MKLDEFLSNKFMKGQHIVDKETYDKIVTEKGSDFALDFIKNQISISMLTKHYQDVNKHIENVEQVNEVSGREEIKFTSEIVLMSSQDFYRLMHYLCSLPMRESTNLANRLEGILEKYDEDYET